MFITNFSSYFEIFTGVNLGFTVFKYFRKELSDTLYLNEFKSKDDFEGLVNEIIEKEENYKNKDKNIHNKLVKLREEVEIQGEKLAIRESEERKFLDTLEPIAFITALYCIYLIIIGGIQLRSDVKDNLFYLEQIDNNTIILGSVIYTFCYYIFCGTFSERIITNAISFDLKEIFIIFIVFVGFSWLLNCIHGVYNISLFTCIFFLPILVYFSMVTIKIFKSTKYKSRKLNDSLKKIFTEITLRWRIVTFFLVILFIAYIPVITCLKFDFLSITIRDVLFHILILSVPLILYIFITLRTIRHKIKYRKLYGDHYNKYLNVFTPILDIL